MEINYKIKRSLKVGIACAFAMGLNFSLLAQTDDDDLNTESVFTGVETLEIQDAQKFDSHPTTYESVVEMPTITYSLIPNKLETNYSPSLIKPAKIQIEEKLKKLYRGYIKAGFGTYNTPLAEVRFMDGRSRNGSFSVFAKYNASTGGVALDKDIDDGYRDAQVSLWGKRFIKKHVLEGKFDWKNNRFNFFGFDPQYYPDADTENIHRNINNLGAGILLKSHYRDTTKMNYNFEMQFNNMSDNFNSVLNELNFIGFAKKHVEDNLIFGNINIEYDQYNYINRADGQENGFDNVFVKIAPQAQTVKGNLTATAGAAIVINSRGEQPFHFYPLAHVKYNLFDNMFVPYAGIKGKLVQHSYRSLVEMNPYVITDPKIMPTNHKFEIYGGIRGELTPITSFNARISQSQIDDFVFWANDTISSPGSMLVPEYDKVSLTEVMAEVTINTSKEMDLYLKGQYFLYGMGESISDTPWLQPTTKFTMAGRYNMQDKIIAELELYTVGKRKGKSYAPIEGVTPTQNGHYITELKGYADVNLTLEYRYTKRLSAFLKMNNMIAAKYQRFVYYPSQRFVAMLGATYSF